MMAEIDVPTKWGGFSFQVSQDMGHLFGTSL